MKKFLKDFSAGRAILNLFSISLVTATLVNAQTPTGKGSSTSSSVPAQSQVPAAKALTTTTPSSATTADKGSDAKKSADPKALEKVKEKEKEKDSESTETNLQSEEEAEEAYRQAELSKMRRKIFGYQLFNNPNVSFAPSDNIATPVIIPLVQAMN